MREIELDIPLGRIAGYRWGPADAVPVMALHGWLDNAASFVPLAAHLPNIDLVAIDLPGHGKSVHLPAGVDYSFAGALHNVLDAADALGWQRFALLGHSMGAGIGSLLAAACPERVERFVAIEALGALAETPERTVERLREAVAAARALSSKRLRVFPEIDSAIRARMQANRLAESAARLLVERGTTAVDGGYIWSSDPRLTVPTMLRLTETQIQNLILGIGCPTRVLYADPPQPYFMEPLRSERAALVPHGDMRVIRGGHHTHMEQPETIAKAIGNFFIEKD